MSTITILSMFKNESRHAREWVEHHKLEGVTNFLLLDNGSTDGSAELFRSLGCRVFDYPERHSQEKAFNEYGACPAGWDRNSKKYIHTDWIMIIDVDEYVYAKGEYNTIPEYLDTLSEHVDGVRLQWKLFGSSGLAGEPTSVINSFTERAPCHIDLPPPKLWNYKTIFRNRALGMPRKIYVHAPEPLGQVIYPVEYNSNDPTRAFVSGGRMECEKRHMFKDSEKKLSINHYAVGSKEDYLNVRSVKGDVNIQAWDDNFRNYEYFKTLDYNDVHDNELKDKRAKDNWSSRFEPIRSKIYNIPSNTIVKNSTVFCYWDKGFDHMPDALRHVYFHNLNVCRSHNINLVLLTDDNIVKYFDVCDAFGKLKANHKSDYVRWKFLNKYGGCWIDCDIMLLKNIFDIKHDSDLFVFPELELTTEQYKAMIQHGADSREILNSKDQPDLISNDIDYCKVGCCVLIGKVGSKVLKWCENNMLRVARTGIGKGVFDDDGTVGYNVLPWHVLGPLVCTEAMRKFSHNCRVHNQGREDPCGFNTVTWKVDKDLPGYDEHNLPGFNKSQWLLDSADKAKVTAENILSNEQAWCIPVWSIYRENDLKNDESIFTTDRSIYKYLLI